MYAKKIATYSDENKFAEKTKAPNVNLSDYLHLFGSESLFSQNMESLLCLTMVLSNLKSITKRSMPSSTPRLRTWLKDMLKPITEVLFIATSMKTKGLLLKKSTRWRKKNKLRRKLMKLSSKKKKSEEKWKIWSKIFEQDPATQIRIWISINKWRE